jgi:hypothetical protein
VLQRSRSPPCSLLTAEDLATNGNPSSTRPHSRKGRPKWTTRSPTRCRWQGRRQVQGLPPQVCIKLLQHELILQSWMPYTPVSCVQSRRLLWPTERRGRMSAMLPVFPHHEAAHGHLSHLHPPGLSGPVHGHGPTGRIHKQQSQRPGGATINGLSRRHVKGKLARKCIGRC